jgi:hypothetical protein
VAPRCLEHGGGIHGQGCRVRTALLDQEREQRRDPGAEAELEALVRPVEPRKARGGLGRAQGQRRAQLLARRQRERVEFLAGQGVPAAKLSQPSGSPRSRPRRNQVTR